MSRERLRGLDVGETAAATRKQVPRRPIVIAIDFERTFTADRNLWKAFIVGAARVGHTIICVTTQRDNTKNRRQLQESFGDVFSFLAEVFYTGGMPKRGYAMLHGRKVDVWIDDIPETVGAATHHEVREAEARFPTQETLPF